MNLDKREILSRLTLSDWQSLIPSLKQGAGKAAQGHYDHDPSLSVDSGTCDDNALRLCSTVHLRRYRDSLVASEDYPTPRINSLVDSITFILDEMREQGGRP